MGFGRLLKRLIVREHRGDIHELTLHVVFELYDQLVVDIEGLERVFPIFDSHEGFLVRVDLSEKLLDKGEAEVEAFESVVLISELFEFLKVDLACTLTCLFEAFFNRIELLRDDQANLLQRCHFPVMDVSLSESSSH